MEEHKRFAEPVKASNGFAAKRSSLENALNDAEKEKQILNALCINYTAAYCCDLLTDRMDVIKQKSISPVPKATCRIPTAIRNGSAIRMSMS